MESTNTIEDGVQDRQCYPEDLAEFILPLLQAEQSRDAENFQSAHGFEIPSIATLKRILSCAYQASLQTDEQRPVTYRLILGAPEAYPQDHGPHGLQCFEFISSLPFTPYEIRKLSPAVAFHRSLIGIALTDELGLRIWGSVHSGPRWLKALQGGRANEPPMPPALVVRVSGPGRIEIARGALTLGQLSEGRLYGPAMNVYLSEWLPENFSRSRSGLLDLHLADRAVASEEWADLDLNCLAILRQHITKRMLAAARAYKHGGTFLWISNEMKEQVLADRNPYVDIKYQFAPGEQRYRIRKLMVEILNTLARGGMRSGDKKRPIEWKDYEASVDPILNELDEAIFEMSHFVANLTAIDGAVVLTKEYEVLGFGGEIHCSQHEVSTIARAVDLEGDNVQLESIYQVGTRHRSVYRFCNAIDDAVGQVISQDGNVRFVARKNDMVTYWDHQAVADSFG